MLRPLIALNSAGQRAIGGSSGRLVDTLRLLAKSVRIAAQIFVTTGAVIVCVAACGRGEGTLTGPRVQEYSDDTTALVAGPSDGGSDSGLMGTLVIGPGRCIGVDVGGRTIPVVFGNGTVLATSEFKVRIDGDDYQIGDRVSVGGGSAQPPYPSRVPDVPAACVSAESELFITNGG